MLTQKNKYKNERYNKMFETEGFKFNKDFERALEECPDEVYDEIKKSKKKRPVTEKIYIEQIEEISCLKCMKEENCKNKGKTCNEFDFIFKVAEI